MKISEFRVDEGLLDAIHRRITGNYSGSDTARGDRIITRGQQSFINTFVTTTQAAIAAGLGSIINPDPNAKPRRRPAFENRYEKLNSLLEQIINEAPAYPDTISSYVMRAFLQYMKGVTGLQAIMPNVKKQANLAQRTYSTDKGQAALVALAKIGWAASMAMRPDPTTAPPKAPSEFSRPITVDKDKWVKGPSGWVNAKDGTRAGAALVPMLDAELAKTP